MNMRLEKEGKEIPHQSPPRATSQTGLEEGIRWMGGARGGRGEQGVLVWLMKASRLILWGPSISTFRDMLCSSCCLLPPLMSAVSLWVSIVLRWGRWEEGEVDWVGERGREGEREGVGEGGRWINELPKDTAVLKTFLQAREKQMSGASVLLARLGGYRGRQQMMHWIYPCHWNQALIYLYMNLISSHSTSPLSRVLLSSLLYCLFSSLLHIHLFMLYCRLEWIPVECDCRGLLERTFAMRRVRGEDMMGRWDIGRTWEEARREVSESEYV